MTTEKELKKRLEKKKAQQEEMTNRELKELKEAQAVFMPAKPPAPKPGEKEKPEEDVMKRIFAAIPKKFKPELSKDGEEVKCKGFGFKRGPEGVIYVNFGNPPTEESVRNALEVINGFGPGVLHIGANCPDEVRELILQTMQEGKYENISVAGLMPEEQNKFPNLKAPLEGYKPPKCLEEAKKEERKYEPPSPFKKELTR